VTTEDRLTFYTICDIQAFAKAVVSMRDVSQRTYYDGKELMPWFNKPVFKNNFPSTLGLQEWELTDFVSAYKIQ
jgi:hypothetical protein